MSSPAWPDLSGLASLARDQRLDVRPVLLRVQTDLFVTAPARDRATVEAFAALASGLLRTVDDITAARVARKLSPCPDTPEDLLLLLVARGGEARRAVIEHAPRLSPDVWEATLQVGGSLAEALASRADLDRRTLDRLADLEDDGVDFALAMNRRIILRGEALERLLERARGHAALAQALLARGDLTAQEEAVLYIEADSSQRARIRGRLETAAALRSNGARRADEDEVTELAVLAGLGDQDAFGRRLAVSLGLDAVPDWKFHVPARHHLLALALVAAGVPSEAAIDIFLTLDSRIGCCAHTVFDLAALSRTVPQPVAASIVQATLGLSFETRRPGRHAPAMAPSGAFARAGGLAQGDRDRRPLSDRARYAGSAS